jgi:uncharacterized protein (DUF169 family)
VGRKIYEVIEAVLALPRAERAVVMERLKENLEEPDVPGGIIVEPQDLVEFGAGTSSRRTAATSGKP